MLNFRRNTVIVKKTGAKFQLLSSEIAIECMWNVISTEINGRENTVGSEQDSKQGIIIIIQNTFIMKHYCAKPSACLLAIQPVHVHIYCVVQ